MSNNPNMDLMTRYLEKVIDHVQKGTLREGVRDNIKTGPMQIDSTDGDHDSVLVYVQDVDTGLTLGTLTDDIAQDAGYSCADEVRADLRHIYCDEIKRYPNGMDDDHPVTFIKWDTPVILHGVRPNAPQLCEAPGLTNLTP